MAEHRTLTGLQINFAIDARLDHQPRGGTARERQAWRNGMRELIEALGELINNDPEYFTTGREREFWPADEADPAAIQPLINRAPPVEAIPDLKDESRQTGDES